MKTKRKKKRRTIAPIHESTPIMNASLIFAKDAAINGEYMDWRAQTVYKFLGVEQYQGMAMAKVTCLTEMGDRWKPFHVSVGYPFLDNPSLLKQIRAKNVKQLTDRDEGEKETRKRTAAKPKLDSAGVPIPKKPKREVDARTGYGVGTTGQAMGEIMLNAKMNKDKALPKMRTWLEKSFDKKKARGLASSWWSTLVTRKPEIYGRKGK